MARVHTMRTPTLRTKLIKLLMRGSLLFRWGYQTGARQARREMYRSFGEAVRLSAERKAARAWQFARANEGHIIMLQGTIATLQDELITRQNRIYELERNARVRGDMP